MVTCYGPPLTKSEWEKAVETVAAIVTICSLQPNDGFVGAEELLDELRRRSTAKMTFKI